ncbi:MAG: CRISPR-associated protein Cas4 [Spirulinaceae cyanobacterium SM2_1_0]|nr:CRISPR-associated protein Cas4 [Spirulinaceae cyanobacterium SM2_1_0]
MDTEKDRDFVMLSALQHYVFCPRQCALIHLEQTFAENLYTLRGRRVHERVDRPEYEVLETGLRVERALPLRSERYRLYGVADAVEFDETGTPYPIEYKSGRKRSRLADEVQLCAQALCLEEMLNCTIPAGAIFHQASRRRREVVFSDALRAQVIAAAEGVRQLLAVDRLPAAVSDKRCQDCSLIDACLPDVTSVNTTLPNPFTLLPEEP